MDNKQYVGISLPVLVYAIVTVFFLINLYTLNQILLSEFRDDNIIEFFMYNDYQPVKYLGLAVTLFILGLGCFCYLIYCFRQKCSSLSEMVVAMILAIVNIVLLVLLIKFINIPILQKAFTFLTILVGGGYIYIQK